MNRPRPSKALLVAAAMLLLAGVAGAGELSFQRIPWRELMFEGHKLGISLQAELELEFVPTRRVAVDLLPSERTPGIAPAGEQVLLVHLRSAVLGRKSDINLWVDPESAAALQRIQTDSGRRQRVKSARYGEGGISSVRRRPAKGEEGLPPGKWTDVRPSFLAYPAWAGHELRVSDPTALFYVVGTAALQKPGDRVQIPLFSDHDLLMLEVKVVERVRIQVDYEVTPGGAGQRRAGSVDALRLSLDARRLGPGDAQESFELAGLRGDVEMLLDPVDRVPLEISGNVPYVGRVAIQVQRVVLRTDLPAKATGQPQESNPASGQP